MTYEWAKRCERLHNALKDGITTRKEWCRAMRIDSVTMWKKYKTWRKERGIE